MLSPGELVNDVIDFVKEAAEKKKIGIIQGDAVPQLFIPKMIRLYRAGRFPFDRLIKFYDFRGINRAVSDSRRGRTIKPVMRMNQGRPNDFRV